MTTSESKSGGRGGAASAPRIRRATTVGALASGPRNGARSRGAPVAESRHSATRVAEPREPTETSLREARGSSPVSRSGSSAAVRRKQARQASGGSPSPSKRHSRRWTSANAGGGSALTSFAQVRDVAPPSYTRRSFALPSTTSTSAPSRRQPARSVAATSASTCGALLATVLACPTLANTAQSSCRPQQSKARSKGAPPRPPASAAVRIWVASSLCGEV